MAANDHPGSGMASLLPGVLRRCRKQRRRTKLSDSTGASLTGGETLVRALALRRVLRRHYLAPDEEHVGVIMPPTVAGAVVNLALSLDRRAPVNLNFVLSADALQHSIELAGIRHVITSRKVLERLKLSFNATTIILEDIPPLVTALDKAAAAAMGLAMPLPLLERQIGLHQISDDDLFTILFTSGATAEPKGVMLSHRNIAVNVEAVAARIGIRADDVLIGLLPFFHSFGLTITLWLPLFTDASVTYHPSPLEPEAIGKLTREHGGTILLATPTLLRLYTQRIPAEDFTTVNMVATGAERLSPEIAGRFAEKFGVRPFEGYGVTEAAPAIAFNVPEDRWKGEGPAPIRPGTVGKPIPGVAIRVIDRETGNDADPGEEGVLWVKGPNIMLGYLHRPDLTARAMHDGWYNTGDIVRVDEDGFITITGRESQFSKVAGETVPHLLIEERIDEILREHNGSELHAAVTAVPHSRRGERIVVVHPPLPVPADTIARELQEKGLPPLFIPNPDSFVEVESIPMLGSGKVDLRALKAIAQSAFDAEGNRLPG
jgi:acyl-[acyl-carrier-protein]-phospholipid O-acyltransferase/long-chain-fatty-acid--[acyl-carrier-protein] ligase